MRKILLVEDQLDFQASVKLILQESYDVFVASTAEAGFQLMNQYDFRLLLLDVLLPDENGFSLYDKIRSSEKFKNMPVIFLTGQCEVDDRVKGLSKGALDYIVKPFEPREFKARIDSHMGRALAAIAENPIFKKGRLSVNAIKKTCTVADSASGSRLLDLTPYEFELLFYLLRNEGKIISRQQLMADVWHEINVLSRTVDRHISSLRKKLDADFETLEAIHGRGYRISVKAHENHVSRK